jgi:hypothetical protein
VPKEVSKEVITAIKDNTVMYIHGNDANYNSDFLDTALAVESFAQEPVETLATI